MIKLGISAINFGYGPTSKALAIVKELAKRLPVHWSVFCEGVSKEYFEKELPLVSNIEYDIYGHSEMEYSTHCPGLAGFLLVSDDGSISNKVEKYVDMYFVDGLGFMWGENDLEWMQAVRNAKRYYALDILDAYDNLQRLQIKNLFKINPILQLVPDETNQSYRNVVHFGGMYVPFSSDTSSLYVATLASIANLISDDYTILASKYGRDRFAKELKGLPTQTVSQATAIAIYEKAECVITLTGPTAVIELATMRKPCIPLLAQNYSQVLTVRKLVERFSNEMPQSWHLLSAAYSRVADFLPEQEGLKEVANVNAELLHDKVFLENFNFTLKKELEALPMLPKSLIVKKSGAIDIVDDMLQCLGIA